VRARSGFLISSPLLSVYRLGGQKLKGLETLSFLSREFRGPDAPLSVDGGVVRPPNDHPHMPVNVIAANV